MKLHDQHVHTIYSADSMASLEEYYLKAQHLGCQYFVTTEHVDLDIAGKGVDWLADFSALKKHLEKIAIPYGPIPLLGIELGYRKDLILRFQKIFEDNQFDIINLSVHDSGNSDYYYIDGFIEKGIKNTLRYYYQQMFEAIQNFDNFNVLSHINYGYKTVYKFDHNYDFFSDIDIIEKILLSLIKKEKALEINTKVADDLPIEHTINLLKLYKRLGGTKLTISSDAHEVSRYLESFDKYLKIIKEIGFKYLCYYVAKKEKHFEI